MNEQIIAQFENLLNPAAKRYLRRIIAGEVPLVLEQGVNPIPEGLDSEQMRVVHQIAQAASAENLNLSRIVNSGVLRSPGGGGNAPTSEVDLYNMLYNVTSGRTLGDVGPPDPAAQVSSSRVPGEGSAQGREIDLSRGANESTDQTASFRYPIVDPQSPKGRGLQTISNLLDPLYGNYLLFGEERTGGQSITDVDKRFLDNVRNNPFEYDLSQYSNYINTELGASYQSRYNAVRDFLNTPADRFNQAENRYQEQVAFSGLQREFETVPPATQPVAPEEGVPPPRPVSSTIIGDSTAPEGLLASRQIGAGATDSGQPAAATGAQDIEPGELARPGAATGMVSTTRIENGQIVSTTRPGGMPTTDTGDGAGVGGVPAVETPYADAVPADWELAASEIYGAYFHIIKQDPIIAELVARAAFEEWEPDKFQYELEQTNWWKTTSANARQFDNEYARDPATVQADIDAYAADLRQSALDLNIRLTNEQLNKLAFDALRGGLKAQQVINALGTLAIGSAEGVTALRYGFYGNKINELAANYGVSISDDEFGQLVNRFAVGQENEDSITSIFQTRATALFPALSERLMAGETFSQIVEPYRYRASQILDRDFAATDFMDNDSFAQAVTYIGDDGKQRPMTYTEWGQYLRSNREFGYEFTEEAQSRAYQVANSIADMFGAI